MSNPPLRIVLFCLFMLTVQTLEAVLPVTYWRVAHEAGWLALSCADGGVVKLSVIDDEGTARLEALYPGENMDRKHPILRLNEPTPPFSPWWSSHDSFSDLRRLLKQNEDAHGSVQVSQDGASLALLPRPFPGDPSPEPLKLSRLAKSIELPTVDPMSRAWGIRFCPAFPDSPEIALNRAFLSFVESLDPQARAHESSDRRSGEHPATILNELRLLAFDDDLCSALVLTRAQRGYARTSISLRSLNLRRNADGQWETHDPLTAIRDEAAFRESIREALNAQEADGDFFAREVPLPLSEEGRRWYQPLQIGGSLFLFFEPYNVTAGAFGVIAVRLPMPE